MSSNSGRAIPPDVGPIFPPLGGAGGQGFATAPARERHNPLLKRLVDEAGNPQSIATGAVAANIFSVDVEDWFHILSVPGAHAIAEWDRLPSHVERNFMLLLDLFSEKKATATCFFLGWIAERFPRIVKEAAARGHEIASHGYHHQLVFDMSQQEFYQDTVQSRRLLEDITGAPVLGYRSPSFSTAEWFFETLVDAGYCYDASVFPAPRENGGTLESIRAPHLLKLKNGHLFEFPMSVHSVMGQPVCFSGGGYLRLLPYSVIRHCSQRVSKVGLPVVFYIHPREIDPHHPRIKMSIRRRFKTYVNLDTTEPKLNELLAEFPVTSFREYLFRNAKSMQVVTPGNAT